MASSTSAAYISTCDLARPGLREVQRQQRGQRVGGREQREADLVRVADQHGQRHRLAERAAEAQHERAEDAGGRRRQHHLEDRLPARGAHAVGRLLHLVWHEAQRVLGDRRDRGQDHDGEHQRGRRQAGAAQRGPEERDPAERARRASRPAAASRAPRRRCPTARRRRWGSPRAARRWCGTPGASRGGRKSWVRKIAMTTPKNPPISSASREL